MKPTADPAAKTVFDQSTFSTVNRETVGGRLLRGIDGSEKSEGVGLFNVNVPTKEWISLMGASAEPNENQSVSPSSWSVRMKHVPNDSDGGLYTPPPTPPESGRFQKAKIAENDHVTHGPTFLAGVHGLRGLWRTQPRLNMEKLPALLATIYIYLPNP